MRLRGNEFCPVHKSISCCGRELIPKTRTLRLGVQRIEDPHHPRGWAELGETTTQTIFKQLIGGATEKKDRPEWTIEPCTCAHLWQGQFRSTRVTDQLLRCGMS